MGFAKTAGDGASAAAGRSNAAPRREDGSLAVPSFILLHGFAQTPAAWDEVVGALQAAGHRTFVPDLYGWLGEEGSSSLPPCDTEVGRCEWGTPRDTPPRDTPPGRRPEMDRPSGEAAHGGASAEEASPLAVVCGRLARVVHRMAAVEGAPVLVGYSLGGRLAAETLVRHPDLPLAGVVLESAGLGPADEAARVELAQRNATWAARLRTDGVAAFMDWWETLPLFASQRALPAATRAAVRAQRMTQGADGLAHSLEAWGAQHQATEGETLAALRAVQARGVLVRYLAGALDVKYAAAAERVRAAGLPVTVVPDAGHNIHLERPRAFVAALPKSRA